ncbi:RNA polymerase II elongation factor ELL isoform X1 [Zootoca vivipara]|uniref:RNA polymerase II elongation factor ELL isoform X1 n=1 Tax=Zootoca vivipara TaxID=8524 RepID=UPI001590481D|nr:RNA polymerase II elongation factor ELL isoform X1 [Zootoca vivipara]XP_060131328.1 RNA polymerase II elongation factor ELL isoform X1 [Zootoca vivipara]
MAALAEGGYALSCGRLGRGTRVSVFHVKLTDSALRAFEAYQGRKDSVALKPSIQFEGSQGHISIPRPDGAAGAQTFSFYLSNIGKDSPQGSFDCVQQYVSSSNGNIQLDCLGSIQDKITVCATDDSYQKAKQSMALVEEETRSRGAIVIKPGGRYVGKTVKVRKPAPGASDAVPSRIRPTPVNMASAIKKGNSAVSQRPFRDRVLHLLALKPYKKPELLLRLQKDGLTPQDKDSLDGLLQQVANMNAKDSTFTLKDYLYKEVQKDWPGYLEGDQQLLKRILFRKLCQPQNTTCPPEAPAPASPKDNANISSSSCSPPQKRPQPTDFTDPLSNKKPRISHFAQRTQPTLNGKLRSANGREAPLAPPPEVVTSSNLLPALELPRPHNPLADVSNDLGHSGPNFEAPDPAERLAVAAAEVPLQPVTDSVQVSKRSKKRLKKERERRAAEQESEPREKPNCSLRKRSSKTTAPSSQDAAGLNGTCNSSSVPTSTSETPDYFLKYGPISSSEQRQSYKNDFNAEYSEYRDLHARIERVTRRFMQLDSQLRQLLQGSEEYKSIHDQILQEYRKIKKTNPNYSQEKNRCEYLHNKLAHIKKLIAEYDQLQFQSWH